MTPEEAMKSKFAADMPEDDRPTLKLLLDAIATTAKENETRRCAKIAYYVCKPSRVPGDEILRTGGLEAEE